MSRTSLAQRATAALCLLLWAGCSARDTHSPADRIAVWLYAGRLDSLVAHAAPELQASMEERGGWERFYSGVIQALGPETEEVERTIFTRAGVTHEVRTVRYQADPDRLRHLWIATDAEGTVHRLSLRLVDETLCTSSRKPRMCFRLPFSGAWTVLNGGPLREENPYAVDPLQCYALEWVRLRESRTHRGDGSRNADYYAYGLPILAPASGVVAAVENRVVENRPGTPNYNAPMGNMLVLNHHTGEFSVLAGFQPGSIPFGVGDTVVAGQVVGRCGNTGLSREPKIHMHLQSAADGGEGLPLGFTQVRVNGARRPYAKPVAGEVCTSLWTDSTAGVQQ